MKRILFVDDDVQVLDGLRQVLRKQRRQWDMVFVVGGEAALARLREAPFDVIVSDMRMPGMDGAMLLQRVKDEFPSVIRIILSGHAEREAIVRALPVSHQYLAKPCDGETIRGVLERACRLRSLLQNDELRRLVGNTDKLPSLPRAYGELTRALADERSSPRNIAEIAETDPAMSAKLLQLVNSSYFGLAHPISAVEPAIVYLGFELVRSLALTAQIFGTLEEAPQVRGFSFERLQHQCLLSARVARRIPSDPKQQEEAFTAALLHDVGLVLLAVGVPDRFAEIVAAARREQKPLHVVEQEILGVTHAEVGAYLLGLWSLPLPIVEAVAYHHTPSPVAPQRVDALAAVHIADALIDALVPPAAGESGRVTLDPAYLDALGVTGDVPRWAALAQEEVRRAEAGACV